MTHSKCLICDSTEIKSMHNYQTTKLMSCNTCSFVFCSQIPSKEELIHYYGNQYNRTNYLSPITVERYNELLDRFEPYRKTGKLLEIGAGYGFFAQIAQQRGWEVFGTELTQEAVAKCEEKGIKMFKGELQNTGYDENEFDVIVCIEVIEHINTPNECLQKANKILRPGGFFYMTTPNFNSILRYRLKEKYDVIEYPNHLCYFTLKTLKKAMNQNGFNTNSLTTTGYSITRLKTSKGKSNQDYVSETSDDEMLRYKLEGKWYLRWAKRLVNGFLNLFKIGDSIKGSFIKE